MKEFEHNDSTYGVDEHGRLFQKSGGIWGNILYTNDGDLRTKAFANGWKGEIKKENLIDGGFHNPVIRNNV